MATRIGDLYFEVTADTIDARESIGAVGSAAVEAGRLISGAISVAMDAATFAVKASVAVITKEILEAGVVLNKSSQLSFGLFEALTGSLETATDLMRELGQLSLDVPIFDSQQLQETVSLLLTFNVAADQAFELAQNINLAAIALDRGKVGAIALARAIGQIQGRGFLEGDEARQLSEVGVNAYQAIADATGRTTAEVIELGRQGKLLAEDVIPILSQSLEDTFGPVSQKLVETYTAQVQGLESIFSGIGSAIVEPFVGRAGGGVLTEFLADVREELVSVVEVADDGTFKLTGTLESLNELTSALADGFARIGQSITSNLGDALSGGGTSDFISSIAESIPDVIDTLGDLASGAGELIGDLKTEIEPIIPSVVDLVEILYDFGRQALPLVAEGLVDLVRIAAPIAKELLEIGNGLLQVASPVIIAALEALVDLLDALADILEPIAPFIDDIVVAFVAYKAAIIAAEIATASFVTVSLSPLLATIVAIAPAVAVALAALGTFNALKAGLTGDKGFLTQDVAFYEKPFQLAGQFGFALGGGDLGLLKQNEEFATAEAAAESFNLSLLAGVETFAEARAEALSFGESMEISADQVDHFANIVALAWGRANTAANVQDRISGIVENLSGQFGGIAERSKAIVDSIFGIFDAAAGFGDNFDFLKELKTAADEAWEAVDRLAHADSGATLDDFLRSLPSAAKELTNALSEGTGPLQDLSVSGVLSDVRDDAIKVIRTLAEEYDLSIEEIKALFDERGLSAVIEALGDVTRTTTETIDPLIEKYGQLGVSVDLIREAVNRLEDQRVDNLTSQIDAIRAAMDDARQSIDDAQQAFDDFFSGGTGGLQGAIDDIVLAIPKVGDSIESGLLLGGAQGAATIRQALGGLGQNLGQAFQIGLDQGLTPDEIIRRLGPVYESINQELGSGRGRIATLDFTDGFTPETAAQIQEWMASILDPAQIGTLFSNILGAEGATSGLQAQIDSLQNQIQAEVEFSPEQVQGAIDEIRVVAMTEPVVTKEAAQEIFDVIQDVLDDEELETAIDHAQLVDDILDAAREAEDSIKLDFDADVLFDPVTLQAAAETMGAQFGEAFNRGLAEIAQERWALDNGTTGPADNIERAIMALGEIIRLSAGATVQVDAPISIDDSSDPLTTASEIVSALGAAAGSGGRLSLSSDVFIPVGSRPR